MINILINDSALNNMLLEKSFICNIFLISLPPVQEPSYHAVTGIGWDQFVYETV